MHHLVTSRVKLNINSTLQLKVAHFFSYRSGMKRVFAQVDETSVQFCSARKTMKGNFAYDIILYLSMHHVPEGMLKVSLAGYLTE